MAAFKLHMFFEGYCKKIKEKLILMDLIITFCLFILFMLGSLALGISMIVPLLAGMVMFIILGLKRGFGLRNLFILIKDGGLESMVVVRILLLIGCLTALWRATGTIAYFVYYGIKTIPPSMFILFAFLLCAIMSYALGTSFGVSGTVGVILMTMARAGGVNPVIAAGAMLSGVYFGDRGAPASSCASLVASVTKTNLNKNVRLMLKSSFFPMIICIIVYGLLSIPNGLNASDSQVLSLIEQEFLLSPWCVVPVILLILLVFLGVKIQAVLVIDISLSVVLAVILQGMNVGEVFLQMVKGYTPKIMALSGILSGGGVMSLLEVIGILLASCALAGIFRGTGMLGSIEDKLYSIGTKAGRFTAMIAASLFTCAVFCNQTIGVIMCRQFIYKSYGDTNEERTELMLDLANSVVVIAGLVPWSIACSVPLAMMEADFRSIPFAVYLYASPICWYMQKKILNKNKRKA